MLAVLREEQQDIHPPTDSMAMTSFHHIPQTAIVKSHFYQHERSFTFFSSLFPFRVLDVGQSETIVYTRDSSERE